MLGLILHKVLGDFLIRLLLLLQLLLWRRLLLCSCLLLRILLLTGLLGAVGVGQLEVSFGCRFLARFLGIVTTGASRRLAFSFALLWWGAHYLLQFAVGRLRADGRRAQVRVLVAGLRIEAGVAGWPESGKTSGPQKAGLQQLLLAGVHQLVQVLHPFAGYTETPYIVLARRRAQGARGSSCTNCRSKERSSATC